jgi:monoamine oxidase
VERQVRRGIARDALRQTLVGIFTCDLSEVSLLQALFLIHSHKNLTHLTTIEGGAQQDRLIGGTGALLGAITERLGDAVRIGCPVRGIEQSATGVTVTADGDTVSARHAIVALPPPRAAEISFAPPLPSDHARLLGQMHLGAIWKVAVVYDTPWWRDDGFSGQSLDVESPFVLTLDACASKTPPGIVNLFSMGPAARRLTDLSAAERRALAREALVKRFGPKASRETAYVEQDWSAERWIGGGMLSTVGPGVMTTVGRAIRAPVGRIHWAGTETATITHGGIDGAIRSGERAAAEIVTGEGGS